MYTLLHLVNYRQKCMLNFFCKLLSKCDISGFITLYRFIHHFMMALSCNVKVCWKHWKSVAFIVLLTPQSGNRTSTSLCNSGLRWTIFTWNRDTVVPAEGNGDLQTLICVLVARPRRCLTLSNYVPWQNWMVAYLRMRTLFCGWPVMVNDTHTRRRRRSTWTMWDWNLRRCWL